MDIILLTVTIMIKVSLCIEYGQTSGPRNITRTKGATDVIIPCHFHPAYATPFWKINDKFYYFSDVPPPFMALSSGRGIYIPIVDSSLNGTSFQCFAPSSSGIDLVGSSVSVLTVTEKVGYHHIQTQRHSQDKLTLDHQRFLFTTESFTLAWKVSNNETSGYYKLIAGSRCASGSNRKVLVNYTESKNIVLQPGDVVDERNSSLHINITLFGEESVAFLTLETFQFMFGIITEDIRICTTNNSVSTSSCIKIPPLNGRQTLILAIPFLPDVTGLEEDILCPVHLHTSERCVDLLRCNRLRNTVFANSITICREANNDSNLEMCFHNVTELMNGTKVHFFYSDLHCMPGLMLVSSRTYAHSLQLIVESVTNYLSLDMNSTINNIKVCIDASSKCYQDMAILKFKGCNMNEDLSIADGNNCSHFSIDRACASLYYIELETYTNTTYRWPLKEISGYDNSLDVQPLKCSCQGKDESSLPKSTQVLVIILFMVIFCILATLVTAIVVTSIINCKLLS